MVHGAPSIWQQDATIGRGEASKKNPAGGGDDAADALRYLVATKARTISVRKLRGL